MTSLSTAHAQRKKKSKEVSNTKIDQKYFESLKWRNIGPFRGGRSCTVAGIQSDPNLYYFGTTGGGVWKTTDGGRTVKNISDGYFGGSIGSIAVAESDNNVIYVGGGEQTLRGNVSSGFGMWRTDNAGKTWSEIGLKDSRHVARIRIHPKDYNLVYAAVLGNIYKPNNERGVFRSKDGGQTWKKVLFINNEVGAADLCFDPKNPRVLYATTWRVKRTPYSMSSGGEGSGIWKSTDGGDNWEELTFNDGLPQDTLGIIGIAASPVKSDRVWAMVEAKEGGLFRSDDGGKTWTKLNDERKLRQRAWYYTRVYADPKDEDMVYVLNVRYHRSKDGGKTFESFNSPHSDHHDLWIAPDNPKRMIIADDGGAQVSYDGGATWTGYHNQPTAQFYRVTTDNSFPYRIYAAQQDNSTIRIDHRSSGGSITDKHWEATAGCECGHIAINPEDNDIVFGGCYDGYIDRKDHKNDQVRAVHVWPDNPMGHGAEDMKYRFQWNFPLFYSKHDTKKLYTCSNHVHVSTDEGASWKTISPDLTRDDKSKQGSSGGPITQDNTSVEYYCTIFAATESPLKEGLLWVGSDDGLVHISRDGGENWNNITPSNLPKWAMINTIEADPFDEGTAYIAATLYKTGDFQPYIYKTTNYGASWTKITNGIEAEHFTRVVRADPYHKGILYAGTEAGVYISFNDGKNWQSLQLNLPIVPITDLALKNNNLIASTQGRSIWMIDDLKLLHQMQANFSEYNTILFGPMPTFRMNGWQSDPSATAGTNHPGGVMVHYYLDAITDTTEVKLSFWDPQDRLIRSLSSTAEEEKDQLKFEEGANLYVWNMRYPEATKFDGMILWWGSLNGPQAVPGTYTVRLERDDDVLEQEFDILADPRTGLSQTQLEEQFSFIQSINDKVTESHEAIIQIRAIRDQMNDYQGKIADQEGMEEIIEYATTTDSILTVVEEALYQTKNQSRQDPLNFPIRLTNKLAHLNSLTQGAYPPTAQAKEVKAELTSKIDKHLSVYYEVVEKRIPKLNELIKLKVIDAIILDE